MLLVVSPWVVENLPKAHDVLIYRCHFAVAIDCLIIQVHEEELQMNKLLKLEVRMTEKALQKKNSISYRKYSILPVKNWVNYMMN